METIDLTICMFCNSSDLSEPFGNPGCLECESCESRHYRHGGTWILFPNDSGRRAMEAQAATIRDRSNGEA